VSDEQRLCGPIKLCLSNPTTASTSPARTWLLVLQHPTVALACQSAAQGQEPIW
jgi:hypothetical protein